MSVSNGEHPLTPTQIKRRAREANRPGRRSLHYEKRGVFNVADYHRIQDHRATRRSRAKLVRRSRAANRS